MNEISYNSEKEIEKIRRDSLIKNTVDTTITQTLPEFPGGQKALGLFLQKNLRYPIDAMIGKKEGKVLVQFTVNTKGEIINPTILKSAGKSLDNEALRIVKTMPNWKPAMLNRQPFELTQTLPISFNNLGVINR
ncbi:MAG: energy transducer TonB [Bacteroidota bacterium]